MMNKKLFCILGFILIFVLIKPVFASGSGIITFKYDNFTNFDLIKLDGTNGYAKVINDSSTEGKDVIRLTPADSATAVRGTAYYKKYVSLANDRSFSTYFTFKIIPVGAGADGIVFILNNDTNELGGGGGGMGYAGIDNSIGIEFDTYDNTSWSAPPEKWYGDEGLGWSHIAVNVNGDINIPVATASNSDIGYNFKDQSLYHVWIDYDGLDDTLEVRINRSSNVRPTEPVISTSLDLASILKQDEVYAGFSASTGGSKESHDIYQWYFNNDFTPIDIVNEDYVAAPSVSLTATPVTDIETTLTAVLTNADGSLVSNEQVEFSTNLGRLSGTTATTNEDGEASVTLTNNTNGGAYIKVTAAYGAYDEIIMPPGVPTLEASTENSITLTPIVGAEYKMDAGEWQDSNLFSDLSMGAEYTFYARMKATPTSAASTPTTGVTFSTLPYTLTYNGNGNTGGTAPNDSSTYEYGTTVTVLGQGDLERVGHTFSGWSTSADGTGTTYEENDTFSMGPRDIILYAKWIINGYTVTFLNHDGTELKTETVAHGSNATAPDDPAREGYTFTGWDKVFVNVRSELEVTAQYSINEYKVSFASTGGSAVDFIKADYGTTITEPAVPSKEGYTFGGWYKEAGLINQWNFESDTIPVQDVILYAKWDTVDYSIIYNLDGGVNNGSNPSSYTVETGTITLGKPTKMEYTFLGWYDAGDNKVTQIENGSTGDKTLWAQWISNESLWMSANPDTTTGSENYNQEFTLSIHNDTVLGAVYASDISLGGVFNGLNIAAVDNTSTTVTAEVYGNLLSKGTGTITLNGSKLTTSTSPLTAEVIVGLNNVTYDSNESTGGTVPTDDQDYAIGDSVTVSDNTGNLEKEGCTFGGWNTRADGSGTNFTAGDTFIMGSANVTLYAKWIETPAATYTVTVTANPAAGGTVSGGGAYNEGASVTVTASVYDGYTFTNWTGGGTEVSKNASYTFNLTSDRNLVANFTEILVTTYTVTFEDWDGTVLKTETVNHGGNATAPREPTRSGYSFTGWDKEFTNATSDLIITANYSRNRSSSDDNDDEVRNKTSEEGITVIVNGARETVKKTVAAGQNTARIVIPDERDEVSEVEVNIPRESVQTITDGQINLEITTGNARIQIPSESLQDLADDLFFRVVPVREEEQRREIETRAMVQPAVVQAAGNEEVSVVGRPLTIETNMSSRPATIVLPLKDMPLPEEASERAQYLAGLAVLIEHGDGDLALVRGRIVQYKEDGTYGIEFGINKFSTFTILHIPERLTIRLTVDEPQAEVNSGPYTLDAAPFVRPETNRTMVPLRFVSEALGAQVDWQAGTRKVVIENGDAEIILTIDADQALVNGTPTTLDAPAVLVTPSGRTFVPLRFLSETLGAQVDWESAKQRITIAR